jgi:hypothetical protein
MFPWLMDPRIASYSVAFTLWEKNQQKDGLRAQKYEWSSSRCFNGLRYPQAADAGRDEGTKRVVAYGTGKW